jgi:hypothetical protein
VGHHQVEKKKNNRKSYNATCDIQHVWEGETRSRFYNALGHRLHTAVGCVRLCIGDMDAYAICVLGRCVFRRFDDLCVEGVFGRCLWAWEREEESIGRSVLGVRHMSHLTSSLWLRGRQYVSVK